uniref:EF-hand domain-containing protein n=1 Tax=Kalanchoe fedtschenkoi TaxID=63787 RepID=A0A7N1A425_KALFE
MEELHKVARAYYDNGSPEVRSLAHGFFYSLDTDSDSRISVAEFREFLSREGYINSHVNNFLFNELDRDRNGALDFNEFLTLYYVVKTQNGFCRQCWRCLKGLYFTCVTCFDCPTATTFDLCPDCYSNPNRPTYHPHKNFVDSGLLLRARRRSSADHAPNPCSSHAVQQLMQPAEIQPHNNCQPDSQPVAGLTKTEVALYALDIALAAGATIGAAAFCTIM